ncbi:adenylate/guanylate cyclase domain-containing protein [Lichenihabitans sp. PAMC28606]|uniref:adenylate/guanylate cyclase domain-containing protein n=1 Tax=Lichenihabitans sp. PAMC28606 TaxID=2880932 RepID=UPI001D09DD34|nr:adenylate/guanylate cyclase domain-containing protein [Lichenihabitans sp. PAMC28606]UDL94219.1 adenylate/guanylate cyclase domain-containing protein [Lichenihabitans sp. PAMC28606]
MDDAQRRALSSWLTEQGLAGATEQELLHGFCNSPHCTGLSLSRSLLIIDTLHPVYEGRAFRWRNDGVVEEAVVEYGFSSDGDAAVTWQQSIFYTMLQTDQSEYRIRLTGNEPLPFPALETMRTEGHTDFVATVHRFASRGVIGEMDCVYSYWCTREAAGFDDSKLEALRHLVPTLALAVKCTSLARIAETLVGVYLGRDAGQMVLQGKIRRGTTDRINAVLWFSDLRGYTAISESVAPEEILPMLNDYADAVISSIHDAGGDVLKLIGDGVLAIFKADRPEDACASALKAEAKLRYRLAKLNERRAAEQRPITNAYLGLHIGDVFYGNIGSAERLDFTVIGPAVNEVSRIAAMCRSVDRSVVLSEDFVASVAPSQRERCVSVGRYALRGVRRARHLFSLEDRLT